MGTITTPFQYVPLTTQPASSAYIRLLRLLPGIPEDPIVCELNHIELDAAKDAYIAASYTWGSEEGQQQILLNGTAFRVRKNLYDLLQAFRLHDDSLVLWIDAICIDQYSMAERNHQVHEMGRIYSQAREVHAWLGPAYPNSTEAFDQLTRYLGSERIWEQYKKSSRLYALTATSWPFEILRRSLYWTRIWIVQELVLAQKIILRCGASRIAWHEVEDKRFSTLPISVYETSIFDKIYKTRRLPSSCSFIGLFANFGDLDCADELDKFYSLHGMISDLFEPGSVPLPDYGACVMTVFRDHLLALHGRKTLHSSLDFLWKFMLYFPRLLTGPTACECHGSEVVNISLRVSGVLLQRPNKEDERGRVNRDERNLFDIEGRGRTEAFCCLFDSEDARASSGDVVVLLNQKAPFLSLVIRKSYSVVNNLDTCVGWAVALDDRTRTEENNNARRALGLERPAGTLADFVQGSEFTVDRQDPRFMAIKTTLSLLIGLGRLVKGESAKSSMPVVHVLSQGEHKIAAGRSTYYCGYHDIVH